MNAEPTSAAMALGQTLTQRGDRRPVNLPAYVIREDGSSSEVLLLDLSYDGCSIEVAGDLLPDERVKLSVLRRGIIDARVCWREDDKAGLVFEPEPATARPHWPRRSQRVALDAEISLRRLGHSNYRVRVSDLSPEGCRVELVQLPSIDERLLVKFEGLELLEAEVCWIDGHIAGLRFEKPFHPAVFDLLIARLVRGNAGRA